MTPQQKKREWKWVACFLIALVLTLPFYSANALAVSVQITHNSGEDNIDQFIDAQNDVWRVEATITNAPEETIDPKNVKIKIGNNEAEFQTCSSTALGIGCEYISPLTDGVREDEYDFQVVYNFLNQIDLPDFVSNGDVIKADGSGPKINFNHLEQNSEGKLELDFTVNDKFDEAPSVGIKMIEVVDADTGSVLQTISIPEQGVENYNYLNDGDFDGVLPISLSGEGQKRFKIRARDWLGHDSANDPIKSAQVDFVPPQIKDNLNFSRLGEFMGEVVVATDISVDVFEKNFNEIKAFSSQADVDGNIGECDPDDEEEDLWHCHWNSVEVSPSDSVSITFQAKDDFGNTAERTLSQSFTRDIVTPQLQFLGTEQIFEDRSYVKKSGEHRIILKAQDDGSGLSERNIRLNLLAFGQSTSEAPTECEQDGEVLTCLWDVTHSFSSSGVARIGLSKFEDNAGNSGDLPEIELFIDDAGPTIEYLDVFGVSDIGEKNYFQSNDQLKIKFSAVEVTGLEILLNLNGVVMDAATLYPETEVTRNLNPRDGWQIFNQDFCQKIEGRWDCEIVTDPIKSGPENGVDLEIRIRDTAGNDASSWSPTARNAERFTGRNNDEAEYVFNLLGLTEEENPDYWESGRVRSLIDVDLDTTELIPTRAPIRVTFNSDNSQAKIRAVEMQECVPEEGSTAPELSRTLTYNDNFPDGESSPVSTNLILEFSPFNGRELFALEESDGTFTSITARYTCQLKIFSSIGRDALRSAEVQEVSVEVHFAFTQLGAMDENLAEKIQDIKDGRFFKFASAFSTIEKGLRWLRFIANFLQILAEIAELFSLLSDGLKYNADAVENSVLGSPYGPALRGACVTTQMGTGPVWTAVSVMQVPLGILTCNPSDLARVSSPYGKWQKYVLDAYNLASGRELLGYPASSLYENIYLSIAGLCIPGIAYNLDKAREVYCRKIICYAQEVPSGIATMEACDELYDLQMCEFVYGPLVDFTPLSGIASIGKALKSFFGSLLGWISVAEVVACWKHCMEKSNPVGVTPCSFLFGINKVLGIVNGVVDTIKTRPTVTGSPYCKIADDIDVNEIIGQQRPAGTAPLEGSAEGVSEETPVTLTTGSGSTPDEGGNN